MSMLRIKLEDDGVPLAEIVSVPTPDGNFQTHRVFTGDTPIKARNTTKMLLLARALCEKLAEDIITGAALVPPAAPAECDKALEKGYKDFEKSLGVWKKNKDTPVVANLKKQLKRVTARADKRWKNTRKTTGLTTARVGKDYR